MIIKIKQLSVAAKGATTNDYILYWMENSPLDCFLIRPFKFLPPDRGIEGVWATAVPDLQHGAGDLRSSLENLVLACKIGAKLKNGLNPM